MPSRNATTDDDDSEHVLDVALSLINTKAWGHKARVFAYVRAACRIDGWAATPQRDTSELLGISTGWLQPLLRELTVEDRVLVREPEFPRRPGRRPALFRPNPVVPEWRNVPWLWPRELVLSRVGFRRAPVGWVVTRSTTASQAAIVTRSQAGRPRHNETLVTRSQAGRPRHNQTFVTRSRTASQTSLEPAPLLLSGVPSELSLEAEEREQVERLVLAVEAKTGRTVGRGTRLMRQAAELVQRAELEQLLAAVDAAPTEFWPPMLLGHLRAVVDGRAPAPAGARVRTVAELEERVHKLRVLIATYEENGYDPPPEHLHELSAWENELRQLTQGALA